MGICVKSLNCHFIFKHLLWEFGLSLVFGLVFSLIPGQTKLETLAFRRLLNIVYPPGTLLRLEINFRFNFVNYLCWKLCTNCLISLSPLGACFCQRLLLLTLVGTVIYFRDFTLSNCPGSLYCMNVSHAGWCWPEVVIEDSCTASSV